MVIHLGAGRRKWLSKNLAKDRLISKDRNANLLLKKIAVHSDQNLIHEKVMDSDVRILHHSFRPAPL